MKKIAIIAAISAISSETSATSYELSFAGIDDPYEPTFDDDGFHYQLTQHSASFVSTGPTNTFSISLANMDNYIGTYFQGGDFSYTADWTYYGAAGFLVANNISCTSLDTSDFCNSGILSLTTEGSFQAVTALDAATQTPLGGPTSGAFDLRWTSTTGDGNFDWKLTFAPVPVPAAAWLFGSALVGLVGFKRKK